MSTKEFSMEQKIDAILKTVTETKNDIASIHSELNEIKQENQMLKSKIAVMERKMEDIEKRQKVNDLIFYGISEVNSDSFDGMEMQY